MPRNKLFIQKLYNVTINVMLHVLLEHVRILAS